MKIIEIWICLNLFASLFSVLLCGTEEIDIINAGILFQMLARENLKEELNLAGYIIVQFFITILFLPSTILITVCVFIVFTLRIIWKTFKYVFRKRS